MFIKKIFFVGLGGAGQRHLRIFRDLLPEDTQFSAYRSTGKTPLLNSDFTVNSDTTLKKHYDLRMFNSIERGLENGPDLIVISTPSSLHLETAQKAADRGINIFVEKPFSHNLEGFDLFKDTVLKQEVSFFLSFQRRFHAYIKKVKKIIESGSLGKIISASFNVASYVPDWHQYEDYLQLYACRQGLGGGVLLTEIHEIDLCYWFFGLPAYVYCAGGNYSDVHLDVEDTAHSTLKYEDFSVQINLCFMQKHNRRDFFIAGTKGYAAWDTKGNILTVVDYEKEKENVLSDPDYSNDAMFYSQASYFLNEFKLSNKSYLDAAYASHAIVEAAKESMKKGIEIKL